MIKDYLDKYLKDAMLSGDKVRLNTIRSIKSAFTEYETAKNAKPIDESVEISIIRKLAAQRLDAANQYQEANRLDLYNNEIQEYDILKEFLPKEPSMEDIQSAAENIVTDKNMSMMGSYMKELKKAFPSADGKVLSEVVKKLLTS